MDDLTFYQAYANMYIMEAITKTSTNGSPEDISADNDLLNETRDRQASELESTGIAGKAQAQIDPNLTNQHTKAGVELAVNRDEVTGRLVDSYRIRFDTPQVNPTGEKSTSSQYADVARAHGQAVSLTEGFTIDDVLKVQTMLGELKEAEALGAPAEAPKPDQAATL
jgi:hypothetical protein